MSNLREVMIPASSIGALLAFAPDNSEVVKIPDNFPDALVAEECVATKIKGGPKIPRINGPHKFRHHIEDCTIYRGGDCTETFSLHTSSLVMLGEHFLRERPKRLILANHLGDIRLHKQCKCLPRHILRSRSRADSNTMRGRTELARGGNL